MYLPNGHASILIGMSGKISIVNTVRFFNLVSPENTTQPNSSYSLLCYIHLRGRCVLELGQGEEFVSLKLGTMKADVKMVLTTGAG